MKTANAPFLIIGALACTACTAESSFEALQRASQASTDEKVEAYFVVLEGGGAVAQIPQGMDPRSAEATRLSRKRLAEIDKQQRDLEQKLEAAGAKTIARISRLANVVQVLTDARGAGVIEQLAGVVRVERAPVFYPELNSAVPVTGAPSVWAGTPGYAGDGVTIGIIDSGIDYTHADFAGVGTSANYDGNDPTVLEPGSFPTQKVVGGWDFAGDSYDAENSPVPQPDADPLDCATTIGQQISGGHGTHVAGIAAGTGVLSDGSSFLGPYDQSLGAQAFRVSPGVAPAASLYGLKVFGCQGASTLLGAALDRAADPNMDGSFDDRLDIVNASLGTPYALGTSVTGELVTGLSRVGTLLVAAAGNEGQSFFVTGSPASYPEALSVAASVDNRLINLKVTAPPSAFAEYPAAEAVFTARLAAVGPVSAPLVLAAPALGCTPFSNAAEIAGNIALIDRGTCPFVDKFANAVAAGAVAVIVVDNEAMALPFSMDGAIGASPIPGVMVRLSDGGALKTGLQAGPIEITLDAADPYSGIGSEFIADFSSRGPSAADARLKPEITAPGVAIDSAAVGTGSAAVSNQGTSMASPIVAGAAALARQAHPSFGPYELKANLMNGAANVRDLTGLVYGTSVVGAGRVDIARSAKAEVTAAAAPNTGEVGVSFGTIIALEPTEVTRDFVVTNHGSEPASLTAEVIPTFSRDGVQVNVAPKQLDLASGEAGTMTLTLLVDPVALGNPGPDPGTPALQGNQTPLPRHYLNQASGLVRLAQAEHEDVVLPYTGSLRAAVDLHGVAPSSCEDAPEADSAIEVAIEGDGPHPSPVVSAFQLAALDDEDEDAASNPVVAMTDIRAVGIATNLATAATFDDAQVFFGIAVSGAWSTPARGPLSVVTVGIDADQTGPDEYEIRVEARNPDPPYRDVLMASTYDLTSGERIARYPLNVLTPDVAQTSPFNSSVLVLSARMVELGLNPDAPAFDWAVSSERPDLVISSDTAKGSFDPAQLVIDATSFGLESSPMFVGKGPISVKVSAAARAARGPLDLLLLHHTNPIGKQWEVVSLARSAPGNIALTVDGPLQPVAPTEPIEASFSVSYAGATAAGQTRFSGTVTGATVLSASTSQGSCTGGAVLDCSLGELEPDALVTVVAQLSPNEGQESVLIIGAVTSELGCEASSLDNEATLEVSLASKPIEPGDELQVAGGCTCEAATSRGTRAAWLPVVAFGALAALRHRRKDAQKGRARSA